MSDPATFGADSPPELQGLNPGDLLARGLESFPSRGAAVGWLPPTPAELALLLPQYSIESLLGQGGMGAVYKGLQPGLDREVAIKLLPAEMAADEEFVSRFRREARTLAKLHHPNIVSVYEFGQTSAGHLFFAMEYIAGPDLRQVLRSSGLPPAEALKVVIQICDALQAAHELGVVHRDLKPENVLISPKGYVKLVDFGIARPMNEDFGRLTMSGMMIGTPDYMSPEQRTGEADERTDIYSLGVVLYELLTGRPPHGVFQAPSRRVQVDVRIDEVVLKALQADPEHRYQKVSHMKTDVDRIRTTSPPLAEPRRAIAPTWAPLGRMINSIATQLLPLYHRYSKQARWGAGTLAAFLFVLALAHQLGKTRPAASHPPGVVVAPAASPSDAVQANTVWSTGAGETLTILGRKGEWFKGLYQGDYDNVEREMTGTVKGNQIFWLSKDTVVLRGYGSGDCYGTFDGDKFYLNDYNYAYTSHATFHLVRPGQSPVTKAASSPPPPMSPPATPAAAVPVVSSQPGPAFKPPAIAPAEGQNFWNAAGEEMVWIRPGTFIMGSPASEEGRSPGERQHQVTLTRGYWLGKYEVTQGLFQNVMGINPSSFTHAGLEAPVEMVTWFDAKVFCAKLTEQERTAGHLPAGYQYGLPTEAQWEYACRAGTSGPVYNVHANTPWKIQNDNLAPALDSIAWYGGNSGVHYEGGRVPPGWIEKLNDRQIRGTHPVGGKHPNAWGLYDTIGNVWEWCEDWSDRYPAGSVVDPVGPATGSARVFRGGAWQQAAPSCRAAHRYALPPDHHFDALGFRVALITLPVPSPAQSAKTSVPVAATPADGHSAPSIKIAPAMVQPTPRILLVPAGADWHIPSLNGASFGNWTASGQATLVARDGVLTLTSAGGLAAITSGRTDFSKFDLHVEVAGAADVQAWIGVRVKNLNGNWTGYTSYINGHDGGVSAGHAGRNFASATKAEKPAEYEGGMGKVSTPPEQFFSLDFTIQDNGSLWTKVNGRTTSGVTRQVPVEGQVAIFVSAGALRIRQMDIREHQAQPAAIPALAVPSVAPVASAAPRAGAPSATVDYSTGFEAPQFKDGPFGTGHQLATQSPQWSLFGSQNGADLLDEVRIQSAVARSGAQALSIDAASSNTVASGVSNSFENFEPFVTIQADVMLSGSETHAGWQFAAGDQSVPGGFVGGFYIVPETGRLTLNTPGYPWIGPIVARDVWIRYTLRFNLRTQTYTLSIDNRPVAKDVPFLAPASRLRTFQFHTWGRGNDKAFIDNYSFSATATASLASLGVPTPTGTAPAVATPQR